MNVLNTGRKAIERLQEDEQGFVQWVVLALILVVAVGMWGIYNTFGGTVSDKLDSQEAHVGGTSFGSLGATPRASSATEGSF